MRTVIILSFLALLVASIPVFGAEPVAISGDFGQSWLKKLPYQSTASDEGDVSGLWGWGGVPKGMKVVNGTLEPVDNGTEDIEFAGLAWLGTEPIGPPARVNLTGGPVDFMYPFYSNDPWVLAQHYGTLVRTSLEDLPDSIRNTIDEEYL